MYFLPKHGILQTCDFSERLCKVGYYTAQFVCLAWFCKSLKKIHCVDSGSNKLWLQNPQECDLHRLASVHVSDPNSATQNIVWTNIELMLSHCCSPVKHEAFSTTGVRDSGHNPLQHPQFHEEWRMLNRLVEGSVILTHALIP